ncbi:MAG: DoxX family protein, partial [Acidimicrobiaceae bacterium]
VLVDSAHSVLAIVLAVLCAASALGDFLKFPSVMRAAETVGCPPSLCTVLGLIKVAASVGLIVGLDGNVVGTAAAAGLSIYFVLAVGAHVRVRDRLSGTVPALVMLAISGATLATSF